MAEIRKKGRFSMVAMREKAEELKKIFSNKYFNFFINMILAVGAAVPFMLYLFRNIPFTYEVNDDATIVQILDGSYTGTPDGHAIFIRYPLSWVIKRLYELYPQTSFGVQADGGVNWYVTVIAALEIFAAAAVLFRLLNYFRCNRLLLCLLFDGAILYLWAQCLCNLTFSTVAAFLGCMCLLFFGLARKEELWRPWNLLCVGILGVFSYCMRKQCFYMVIPFLLIELFFKYRLDFFKSVKPWAVTVFCGVLGAVVLMLNAQMYGSGEWKKYYVYNHARAYLQDYTGMPDYEENEALYRSIGVGERGRTALKSYSYCLYDDFSTEMIEKIYNYQKAQEENLTLKQKIRKAKKKAKRFFIKKKQTEEKLKYAGFYVWLTVLPLFLVTLCFKFRAGIFKWLAMVAYGACSAGLLYAEWVYLAMNGRFPQRVEETIRLLTVAAGFLVLCHLLSFWKDTAFSRVNVILQVMLVVLILHGSGYESRIASLTGFQSGRESYCAQKAEVAAYCGKHENNYYILDTQSFNKPSGVKDDLHQGNWFMSGSWTAYSPLYEEKLEKNGLTSLGTDFLLEDNVYIITKGKKNVLNLLGKENTDAFDFEAADEIEVSGNGFFAVYKITKAGQEGEDGE